MPTSLRVFLVSCLLAVTALGAQNGGSGSSTNSTSNPSRADDSRSQPSSPTTSVSATDPSYRLNPGDTLAITIGTQSATEVTASPTISKLGDVRLPWLDDVFVLKNMTVRQAESALEKLYRDREMLKAPVVSVRVANYFLREVQVNGAVARPGPFPFPPDLESMEIGDLIGKVGGFTNYAKASKVTVFHRDANGNETSTPLNLESLLSGKYKVGKGEGNFLIYPGDRIDVPESLL